jgi:hypothetical protein
MKNKAKDMLQRGMAGKKIEKEDKDDEYEMPRSEAIEEHKRLVEVLRSGDKKSQLSEAKRQEAELKKIIKGK